ncbi:hypothetical protein [Paucibacter sp. XJ19-41]|uniref:hypothetical protein n=1 Tax=Paucibacter sp. XJ19-41 TaxID=2927824 RepID=UPI002349D7C1|nr:hypothetical protein [Paucibacter sp. XJ19-41]MDC6167445.1 hypothetical protein [Paucibacter sp. XJ19-41]
MKAYSWIGLIVAALMLPGSVGAFAPASDPAAVAMARRMLGHLGGADRWAQARWMYVREQAHARGAPAVVVWEYWRRLDQPAWWGRSSAADGRVLRLMKMTPTEAWTWREGVLTEQSRESLQEQIGWWHQEIYTMYHRLAREDGGLRLSKTGDFRLSLIDDASGRGLGWFEVDGDGSVVKWSTRYGNDGVEYVYGRPADFANGLRLPRWGSYVDGRWRFEYVDASLHTGAMPTPFERPPST